MGRWGVPNQMAINIEPPKVIIIFQRPSCPCVRAPLPLSALRVFASWGRTVQNSIFTSKGAELLDAHYLQASRGQRRMLTTEGTPFFTESAY
eukprot:6103106-Amphidinium_carterae.2